MNSRVVVALLFALGLSSLSACSKTGVQPPAPRTSAPGSESLAKSRSALDAMPVGCDPSVVRESLGIGWVMGPYEVPADGAAHTFTSASAEAGPGLLVLQNGDGRGSNEAASATVQLGSATLSIQAGTRLVPLPVELAGGDALTITASGGGSVRILVASLGATRPCSLGNLNGSTTDGTVQTTSQIFNAPVGALGILVLLREDPGTIGPGEAIGSASINGGPALTVGQGTVAQAISLVAENTLTLTASGAAGAGYRALVLNVAKRPWLMVMQPPQPWRADSVVNVEGASSGASAVQVGSIATTPGSDGSFRVDMPLSEGLNTIVVAAQDTCGNVTRDCVYAVYDRGAPEILVDGAWDGMVWGVPTTLTWSARDDNLLSAHATLDGVEFASGGVVDTEGPHVLEVSAVDRAGNRATRTVHFTLDLSPPVIAVEGVWDGMVTDAIPVVPNVTATDPNLMGSWLFVNGSEFASGTPITEDGEYQLWFGTQDVFNHWIERRISFAIDTLPPAINIRNVVDGQFSPGAVSPAFDATEPHLSAMSATLDGTAFTSGSEVAAEGEHRLVVSAADAVGHTASRTVSFVIDTIDPVVTIQGVEAYRRTRPTTITFSATDANLESVTGTLDGQPFASGGRVEAEGDHDLMVVARDRAGRERREFRHFYVDVKPPSLRVLTPIDGAITDQDSVDVVASVGDDSSEMAGVSVGTTALATTDGQWFRGRVPLSEYQNDLEVVAADSSGNLTRMKLTVYSVRQPDACTTAAVSDSFGPGWIAGPFDVPGDDQQHDFYIPNDGGPTSGLLVMSSGDERGENEEVWVAYAGVGDPRGTTNNPRIQTEVGGARIAAVPVVLTDFNKLEVAPWHGGTVRVGIARVGSEAPCVLADATATCSGGAANRVFDAIAGERGIGLLTPLPASQPDESTPSRVRVGLNGESLLVETALPGALPVSLLASNALALESLSCGAAEGYRLQVLGMDMGPDLRLTAPAYGTLVASESIGVAGTSPRATSVDASGAPAALVAGDFSAQVPLVEGENAVVVAARNACGDVTRRCRLVIRDTVKPVVEVTSISEGAVLGAPVAVQWTVTEAHLSSTVAKVDGAEIIYGATVSAEGEHVLEVTAVDRAGNVGSALVHFALDYTKPQIAVAGVSEGLVTRQVPVVPTFSATDAHAVSATSTLDGLEFTSGTSVTAEGAHTLVVAATDAAGNADSKTVGFAIDLTAPSITIAGAAEGERRNAAATLTYSASDLHLAAVTGALDGAAFASGGVVSSSGAHELVVTAVDRAGNSREERRHFFIDASAPVITVESPANGLLTNASSVEVVVSVADDGGVASVAVGPVGLSLGGDGKYRGNVSLVENANILDVVALDLAGNTAHQSVTVTRDSAAPQLTVSTPAEGARVAALSTAVAGTAKDGSALSVSVNGASVTLQSDGSFSANIGLTAGANAIAVEAKDGAGNTTTVTRHVRANGTAPHLLLSGLAATTSEASIEVRGTATPGDSADAVQVTVNGAGASVGVGGAFSIVVALAEGPNPIQVVAVDGYGLQSQVSALVTRASAADAGTPGPGPDAGTSGPDASTPSVDGGTPPTVDAGGTVVADAGTSVKPDAGAAKVDAGVSAGGDAGAEIEPAPALIVEAPAEGAVLGTQRIAVTGRIEGGTLPISVTIDGAPATVSGRYFSASLAVAEKDNRALTVQATDNRGRVASVQRTVSIDRTAPYLTVDQPTTNPAVVTVSPYRLEGTVGDAHLSSVTVNGSPAVVLAGKFSATVSLSAGNNDFVIEATDLAGNRSSVTQRLTITGGTPPTVQIVEPMDGAKVASPVVTVRVNVTAFAAVSSVQIGAGPATEVSPGVYQANVALALGSNTITARATDANGLMGSTSIAVSYSDPAQEPLAVTGVDPVDGASGVEPSSLVSVAFNKAVTLASLAGRFTVLAKGSPLAGGYSVAPGGQIATFVAKDPLPEGETLTVRVSGMPAQTGPGQGSDFASQCTVRRPLTLVRGVVTDDGMQPLGGVKVELVGTKLSATTGPDGNWAVFGAPQGTVVASYTGGMTSDGRAMPQVKRRLYVTAETTTRDRALVLTPTNNESAQYVDASHAATLKFGGIYGPLAVDVPANGFVFPNGSLAGFVTATQIAPWALPVPMEARATPAMLWQVGPAGTRVMQPATLTFPNATSAPAGRLALLLAYDDSTQMMARVGFGKVRADGGAIESLAPMAIKSVEYLGYMPLTAEQSDAVAKAMELPGSGVSPLDGGAGFFELQRVRFARMLQPMNLVDLFAAPLEGVAHAQGLLGMVGIASGFMSLDGMFAMSGPAYVVGKVRTPQERTVSITVNEPGLSDNGPVVMSFRQGDTLRVSMLAQVEAETESEATSIVVEGQMKARGPRGTEIPSESSWQGSQPGKVTVGGGVALTELGTTQIELTATAGADRRRVLLEAELAQAGVDAGASSDGGAAANATLTLRKTLDTAETGGEAIQSYGLFGGLMVTAGAGVAGTEENGNYRIDTMAWGDTVGISCATLRNVGNKSVPRLDAYGNMRMEQVPLDVPSCSVKYSLAPWKTTKADILVDARLFTGKLTFVDRQGKALPPVCAGAVTERGATGEVTRISKPDVDTTEVHFFREGHLDTEFAQYALSSGLEQECTGNEETAPSHGSYGQIRFGPTASSTRAARQECLAKGSEAASDPKCNVNGPNFVRLTAGERVVVFAINHATGYAGMTTVTVPQIVRSSRGPNGECEAGSMTTLVSGRWITASRCTMNDLAIWADVVMYPPEIDVRVERRAPDEGVQRPSGVQGHLIRTGGEATTRDEYLQISTRWRVRRPPGDAGTDVDAGIVNAPDDAGNPDADAAFLPRDAGPGVRDAQVPSPIRDPADAGQMLEVLCSELPAGAPKRECLKDDTEWVDVPAGVPSLAGHYVFIRNSALVEAPNNNVFEVKPGQSTASVAVGQRYEDAKGRRVSVNDLDVANWYVHVVGYRLYGHDAGLDTSKPPPELFEEDKGPSEGQNPAGLPKYAIGLKNVYRHYEADGTLRERYDRAREHEFRVVDLQDMEVTANRETRDGGSDGGGAASDAGLTSPERVLLGEADGGAVNGENASAEPNDNSYQFLARLLEPEVPGRATALSGEYAVRLGSDEYGMDCKVTVDALARGIKGDCGGDTLADVLTAGDLLYIELYLSGNAENVLYRFNFYGLAPRRDYLAAGSNFTAEKSIAKNEASGEGAWGRAVSQPSRAEFFVSPARFSAGTMDVCTQLDGTTNQCLASSLLRQSRFALEPDGTYALTETCGQGGVACLSREPFWQEAISGIDGARRFKLPLPPELVAMPGSSREKARANVYAVVRGADAAAASEVLALGIPVGSFSGSHAAAPGQEQVAGIDLADGHLSFEHEDMAARQFNEMVRFARVYDNHNKDPSPLGVGWTHNWDGFVVEETPGRYAVVIGGQARPFPRCTLNENDNSYVCITDNGHGGKLHVANPTAPLPSFTYTNEAGAVHRFDRGSLDSKGRGRRKWLLTAIDDGHARPGSDGQTNTSGWTVLSYQDGTDLLKKVQTRGSLWLDFSYVDVDQSQDTAVPSRIRYLAGARQFKYLQSVSLKQGTEEPIPVLHEVSYTQQRGNLVSAKRTTDLPTQNWVYSYVQVPDGAASVRADLLRSELRLAQLHLSDAAGTGDYVQWEASFDRNGATSYGHVNPASVVTSAVLPGQQGNPFTLDYQTASRKLTRPDGVQATYTLNDYGNVNTAQLPLTQTSAQWGSDTLNGKVKPEVQSAQSGKRVRNSYEDGTLRLTGSVLDAVPTEEHETLPAAGVSERTQLAGLTPDSRYGRSTLTAIPGPNGTIQISTPLDAKGHGDPAEITVRDEQGTVALSRSTTFNDDGMPLTETDELGRQLTYSYDSKNPLGLPDSVTVTMNSPAEGALRTVHRNLHYDRYGRLTGIDEVETGASASWFYDSQGRKLQSSQEGTPRQVWRYTYAPVDEAGKASFAPVMDDATALEALPAKSLVIMTETLEETNHERKQYYADGLLLGETFAYDQPQKLGVRKYRYEKGRLTSSTDERGFVRTYTYDANGRQTKVVVTDSGGVARTEVSYVPDSEGRPTTITGSDGLATAIEYDILGQAARWDYGFADAQGTTRDVESVTRDIRGAVTQRTFGSATPLHVLTTTLDGMGRPLTTTSGSGSAGGVNEARQYDGLGRPTLVEDKELGLKDEYEYKDVLGRMTWHRRTVISGALTLTDREVRTYEDKGTSASSIVHVTHTIATGIGGGTRTKRVDWTLDAAGRKLSSTEWVPPEIAPGDPVAATTSYTYDPRGNLLRMTEPLAPVATADGRQTEAYARANSFTYDALGNRLTATLSDGAVVQFTPNAAGQVESRTGPHPDDRWTFKYDHFGRPVEKKLTPATGSAAAPATWTVVYGPNAKDAKGNDLGAGQVSQTDPAGYTTVASFNARGKLLKQVADDRGASRESTNQQTSEYGYDGPFARSERVSEGQSVGQSVGTTSRKFDDRGRVTWQEEVWAKGAYGYDYETTSLWTGRTVAIEETYISGPATRTRKSAIEVDSQGNTIARTLGSSGAPVTDEWLYDAGGLLTRESLSGKPDRVNTYVEGLLTQSVYGGVEPTAYSYYPDRRLRAVRYPDLLGRVRTSIWNRRGLLDQETYGVGDEVQRTRMTYDAGGFVNAVIEGFSTTDEAARQYVNGPMGETLSVTLPGQVGTFAFGYDGARRLVSLTPPSDSPTPVQTFDWDYLGRPARRTRGPSTWAMEWASGEVTETNPETDVAVRQYDARKRVVHTLLRPGPTTGVSTDLTEVTSYLGGDDQPMQVDEARGSGNVRTSFEYDPVGRIWRITRGSEEVSYAYTASSQRRSVTSPAAVTTYGYDGLDRLLTVTSSQGPSVTYEWEPGGELLLSLQGSGLVERRCYDPRGRMKQIVHASGDAQCSGSLPSGLLSSYGYTYDERGNRTSETFVDGLMMPAVTTYGYDLADRLTGIDGPGSTATFYRLAGDGSRLREKTAVAGGALPGAWYEDVTGFGELVYEYQGADAQGGLSRIVDAGSGALVAGFTSDRAGRVTSETRGGVTRTFTWDADSRLVQVAFSNGAAASRYLYDWQGLRRAKTGASGVGYLWADGEMVEEQPAGGEGKIAYARGVDGTTVGLGGERALHDGLGGVSGRAGAPATQYRTDAWGNLQADPADGNRWAVPPSGGPSLGFGATHWDGDAGLYYAQQRWYDPRTGRWLSEDPVFGDPRNPASLGLWAYANGNPSRYWDPNGESGVDKAKGCAAAVFDYFLLKKGLKGEPVDDWEEGYRDCFPIEWSKLKSVQAVRTKVTGNAAAAAGLGCFTGLISVVHPLSGSADTSNMEPGVRNAYAACAFASAMATPTVGGVKTIASIRPGRIVPPAAGAEAVAVATSSDVRVSGAAAVLPWNGVVQMSGPSEPPELGAGRAKYVSAEEFERRAQARFGGERGRLELSKPRPSGETTVEVDLVSKEALTQVKRVTDPKATFGGKMVAQLEMTIDAAKKSGHKRIRYVLANETSETFVDDIRAVFKDKAPDGMRLEVERISGSE